MKFSEIFSPLWDENTCGEINSEKETVENVGNCYKRRDILMKIIRFYGKFYSA